MDIRPLRYPSIRIVPNERQFNEIRITKRFKIGILAITAHARL